MPAHEFDPELILAAEEFPDDQFREFHTFSDYEDRIIRKLVAHGPILLRGGRGSGKSALLKEASYRINNGAHSESAIAIYVSLRYLPLLRYTEREYERYLCSLLIEKVRELVKKRFPQEAGFDSEPFVGDLQRELASLSSKVQRRIVLLFDDAAHIGREISLKDFFDIFRTLSSNTISCKAAIYPGVTEFGTRFDLLNDANVIDIARSEDSPTFVPFFSDIIRRRYSHRLPPQRFSRTLSLEDVAAFLGRAVTGNARAYIFACNHLADHNEGLVSLLDIEKTLKYLASDYYWPLLDEVKPKLGPYEPLVEPARELGEKVYAVVAGAMSNPTYGPTCLIHRDYVEKLKKLFEVLEYAGFFVKREASRVLKSGGRGTRYSLNLCNLIEVFSPSRLTSEMFKNWTQHEKEFAQIFKNTDLDNIKLPEVNKEDKDLEILEAEIQVLLKSKVYPYGLTERRIEYLRKAGFITVGQLAEASDDAILAVEDIGDYWLNRIKNVVGQAVWM